MVKLEINKIMVNFNSGGDWMEDDLNISKEFATKEEANNYLISKELCEKILDVLEENCEEDSYDEVEVSHTQLAKNYGASIDVKLDDEKFYGEIEVAYKRGKGYYIKYIDYDA